MNFKEIIGIDVSKLTIDVCIHSNGLKECFDNTPKGMKAMLSWVFKKTRFTKQESVFVFEHTGLYDETLTNALVKEKLLFTKISGLEIKRSLGLVRGKDDRVDASRIALYGYRLREELKLSNAINSHIKQLKVMASLRKKLVKQRAGLKMNLKEQKRVLKTKDFKVVFEIQQSLINTLSKKIVKLEKQMLAIIKDNAQTKQTFDLILSVKGVGAVTAIAMIITTENFTKFEEARKFASYCGIAPFPYRSGTSIKGRNKVSHLANKEIKSLLNMCATSAIQHNSEMKDYYQRRVKEGKHKMSTINIIRNKLLARIFAVVNRGTEYVDLLKYAA